MDEWNHLVVVLPGIGGSVLAEPDSGGQPGKVIWSAGFPNISLLARPSLLSRERHPRLIPVGLIPTRRLFRLWTPVHGYDGLLRLLGSIPGAVVDDGTPQGHNPRANVVAVGYDFRLGIADAAKFLQAQLAVRLDELWPGRNRHDGKVVVVAHSLGGLVARYWVAQEDGAQLCRAIITLGTPHRGAPKALDIMANRNDQAPNHRPPTTKGGLIDTGKCDIQLKQRTCRISSPSASPHNKQIVDHLPQFSCDLIR